MEQYATRLKYQAKKCDFQEEEEKTFLLCSRRNSARYIKNSLKRTKKSIL